MSYRTPTPLLKARGLGPAKEGVGHWWVQRLTALALLPLIIWLVLAVALLENHDYLSLREWVAHPVNAVLLIMTALALYWHSALGLQVIFEDYIGSKALRTAVIITVNFAHIMFAVVSVFAVLKIALVSP